ncbi:MAG: leucine--tRNA ligase, partial [Armatimonadota bacterium]
MGDSINTGKQERANGEPAAVGRRTVPIVVYGLTHAVLYSFIALQLWGLAVSAADTGQQNLSDILMWAMLLTPLPLGILFGYITALRSRSGTLSGMLSGLVFSLFMVTVILVTLRDIEMTWTGEIVRLLVALPAAAIIGGAIGGKFYARGEWISDDVDWLDDFDDEEYSDGPSEAGAHALAEFRHSDLSRQEQQQVFLAMGEGRRRTTASPSSKGVLPVDQEYNFAAIENKWQQYWNAENMFHTPQRGEGDPFYLLVMFPYPSGKLHMGHVRNYIIADVIARQKTMAGFNVLHPMGWDAFGLPAENAAIERQIHPHEWTDRCVAQMKEQFGDLGISYDWEREINTSEPDYYHWTQWLFLQMYKNDLAYQGEATVNWCPSCATVLANEELEGDVCERCGTPVEARRVPGQWFFRITDYADRLLDDLKHLDDWPERVRAMQENWIGRSEGFRFHLDIVDSDKTMEVFTTRIDTVYGVTFMVLAPEHPLVRELTEGTEHEEPVREFIGQAMRQDRADRTDAETEKKGVFTGRYAVNPITGEEIPIWVANYVLMDYGTGQIMAVPAHDQRDFEFARKYDIPVRVVIQPEDEKLDGGTMEEAYQGEGVMDNSTEFNGMPSTEAIEAIADTMEENGIGQRDVNYSFLDWLISRQRYWG